MASTTEGEMLEQIRPVNQISTGFCAAGIAVCKGIAIITVVPAFTVGLDQDLFVVLPSA